jgi:cellulose synthase/poly-beta-1,6-N-acetylglucosamine synthase-like glycosyltransferase
VTIFSIIIPVKELNDYVRETVPYILQLDFADWELFIVTNENQNTEWPSESRIKMLSSGRVGPAEKRDIAASVANGKYLVFLDDDSYPDSNLLSLALEKFTQGAAALGGPAVTPPTDSFKQKVSGAVFSSKITGGSPERYRPVGEQREVDDWPSVNLMMSRDIFLKIGGFNSPYWPGEDTFLCLKLLRAGYRVTYVPNLIVWHHRREGLVRHMKQVGAYGLHRGYFARHLPETSRRIQYIFPSLVFLMFLATPIAIVLPALLQQLVLLGMGVYLFAVIFGVFDMMRFEKKTVAMAALPYVIATHLSYGYWFLRGLFRRGQLESKLR